MTSSKLVAAVVLAAVGLSVQAQETPPYSTYFLADDGLSSNSTSALAIGPGGDIWGVAVSAGPSLPIVNPDSNAPPSGECQVGGVIPGMGPLPRRLATGPCTDVVAFRLAGDGSGIVFSKYLGGPGADQVADMAVGADGAAYLTGSRATSPDAQPYTSSYLIGLAPDGVQRFDLELPADFAPQAITLDADGNVYVAGGFPLWDAGDPAVVSIFNGVMVLKVDAETQEIIYQATLEASGRQKVSDIVVGANRRAYVAGLNNSADFPISRHQAAVGGPSDDDVFVAAVHQTGQWLWRASLGGSLAEETPLIHLISDTELMIAGVTESDDFPDLDRNTATQSDGRFWTGLLSPTTGLWQGGGQLGDDEAIRLTGLSQDEDEVLYLSGTVGVASPGTRGFIARLDSPGDAASTSTVVGNQRTQVASRGGQTVVGGMTSPGVVMDAGVKRFARAIYVQPFNLEAPETTPRLDAVLNAAERLAAELSPGAIISLYGVGLGPTEPVSAVPTDGLFPTELAGVQVLVGGQAIPLLFASEGQINAVLPFDLGPDPVVEVRVERDGESSNAFVMSKSENAPELFPVVVHGDGTLNSTANRAKSGDIVSVWVSGVGTLSPPRPDGAVEGVVAPFPAIDASVSAQVAFMDASVVTYAGAAPGFVAGLAQINFTIPEIDRPRLNHGFAIRVGNRETYGQINVTP